ncbi:MAG: cryptochrome/photolyase family protein [Pseudomonadota bacterium]
MAECRLILILGDQLSPSLSSLEAADKGRDQILMVEVMEEATYVRHHKKKIAFLLSAMRHFAEHLRGDGWQVDYVRLDDDGNTGSFTGEIERAIGRRKPTSLLVCEPGEWRVRAMMETWAERFHLPTTILDDDRFVCSHADFARWAEGRKQLRMEHFYREMRQRTGLLMEGKKPVGGRWNFDADNRKPAKPDLLLPQPLPFDPDEITQDVLRLVADRFSDHFGDLNPFWFAVTTAQAEAAFDHFVESTLPLFGDFQDAMLRDHRFLYHSVISHTINAGLLDPFDACRRVETAYDTGQVPLNAAEGFIRQIIGWREYVRGIYWLFMPGYLDNNVFGASRPLPGFYWTGETDMACLSAAITQTKEEAYAHHIQRLMVTGNFAMLAGVEPRAVHEWYLMVYADAYEWVELPNTLGMSQFADGGLLASKPYAASGNYINKMSDYCGTCRYDVKQKTGDGACPFNALYWDFLDRSADVLRGNPRLTNVYATWDRMDGNKQAAYRESAASFLATLQ